MNITFSPVYTSFKSNSRDVRITSDVKKITMDNFDTFDLKLDKLLYSNYTQFFRQSTLAGVEVDLNWKEFRKTIKEQFSKTPNVNVYDFACSDGSETYSLIMTLMDEFGKESEKFFPIQAFDIDKEMIETATSGFVPCNKSDYRRIKNNLSLDTMENFEIIDMSLFSDIRYRHIFRANDELKSKVRFKQSDVADEIKNVKPDNSLVLCRNFWPYLGRGKTTKVLSSLLQKLQSNSLVVIGEFDRTVDYVLPIFEQYGYQEIATNVFKKMK